MKPSATLQKLFLGGSDAASARAILRKQARLPLAKPPKGVRRVGVTTFLAGLRQNVPFSPKYRASPAGKARVRSQRALSLGRVCHRMVEDFVEHGKVPTANTVPAGWARSIIRVLCEARIEPVAAEVAASLGAIRTQVDLVGLRRKPNGKVQIVAVELKTTSKDERAHAAGYDDPCRKMPTIHFGANALANTERNGHHIQAAFGPHGLLNHCPELADIDPRPSACVIVATTTSGLLYNVSPFPAAAYACKVEAPARVKRTMTSNGFDRLPVGDAGRDIRACLKAAGHTKIAKTAKASCATTVGGQRCLVAITGATASSAQLEYRIREAVKKTKGAARAAVVFRGAGGEGWRTKFLV